MLGKLLTMIGVVIAIGAALLGMRHYQLSLRADMAELHREMEQSQQEIWDFQVRIAERARPEALRQAIETSELELEPLTPSGGEGEEASRAEEDERE
jgi:cell division protein FtsL